VSDDLKPCPFCGGEAEYGSHQRGSPGAWENETDHWVFCTSEGCCVHMGMYESTHQATAAWNTRTTLTEIEGEKE
jgi:hypothetical protein